MFIIQFICIITPMIGILTRSLNSESESLLSCSKFHFEEKVLEKVVRLEHKMEVYAEKEKLWEESFLSSLDKVTESKKQTETFVESMRNAHLLDQTRLNDSLFEVKKQTETFVDSMRDAHLKDQMRFNDSFDNVKKQTETFVDSMRDAHLKDQMRFNDSFDDVKKQTEIFVDSMRDAHLKDQMRFNDSFDNVKKQTETFVDSMRDAHLKDQMRFNDSFDDVKKQTEIFVDSMRDAHLKDQTRFNDSFLGAVDRFKLQSENETNFYERHMNELVHSFSSKLQDFNESGSEIESTIKLSFRQEQNRFNKSFDKIVEKFQVRFNNSLQEIAFTQQKVALTACHPTSIVSGGTVVLFTNIKTNIGITDLSAYKSTGKFICTVAGLYHVSAVMTSFTSGQVYFIYKNNDKINTYYGKTGGSYRTGTRVFVTMLDVGDEITVRTSGSQYIHSHSCFTIVKLN